METRTVEQVNQWESHPFSGGLAGLRELADGQFSGAVQAGGAWAFFLNGRVVGVFDGDIDSFEDASGTAYLAPDQALPLLLSMKELGGETQAKYYTNKTPLSEAHETLTQGNFVGYVELSENVLSGDYYVVFYGGRSMSVAFVGESERLVSGDEAFQRADDEVGIYEVKKVGLEVIDLPGGSDESDDAEESTPSGSSPPTQENEPSSAPEPASTPETPSPDSETPTEAEASEQPAAGSIAEAEASVADTSEDDSPVAPEPSPSTAQAATPEPVPSGPDSDDERADSDDDVFSDEQEWRETKTIPSLDPSRSRDTHSQVRSGTKARRTSTGRSARTKPKPTPGAAQTTKAQKQQPQRSSADEATTAEFKQALQQSKREIDRLQKRLSKTETEQQELLAQREDLRAEIKTLQSKLQNQPAGGAGDSATSGATQLPAAEALTKTNLFVRYESKSAPTLEDAIKGSDPDEVNANLSLEYHTQFDADSVVVDGTRYDTFLRESIQYRFVEWVVQNLLYEIRETGHVGGLRELYEAIPRIDRAELSGTATIRKTEDGEEVRTQQTFDVIMRDRMGNPLVVANINDARDPATGDMMADLVSAANDVAESNANLGAAVFVTASFFEPAALETAAEATGGGLLSREKKESYVKLSRKLGYHLSLVETRGGQFHVNVPEL